MKTKQKRNLSAIVIVLAVIMVFSLSCTNVQNEKQKSSKDSDSTEIIKIYVARDTMNYTTSVIESHNVEAPDVLGVQFILKFMNISQPPSAMEKPVILERYEIIENPYESAAPYSIDYVGNPNGFYSQDGKKLEFPLKLNPYEKVSCILKHGQTIDLTTLHFLKSRFKDLKNLKSKEVFQSLLENGLNLCNDKYNTGQVFQVIFYSKNKNYFFTRDVEFPYSNYCK